MTKPQAVNITYRAIELARRAADCGRIAGAKRAWQLACRTSYRCGGLSGTCGAAILIDLRSSGRRHDYVAYAPAGII